MAQHSQTSSPRAAEVPSSAEAVPARARRRAASARARLGTTSSLRKDAGPGQATRAPHALRVAAMHTSRTRHPAPTGDSFRSGWLLIVPGTCSTKFGLVCLVRLAAFAGEFKDVQHSWGIMDTSPGWGCSPKTDKIFLGELWAKSAGLQNLALAMFRSRLPTTGRTKGNPFTWVRVGARLSCRCHVDFLVLPGFLSPPHTHSVPQRFTRHSQWRSASGPARLARRLNVLRGRLVCRRRWPKGSRFFEWIGKEPSVRGTSNGKAQMEHEPSDRPPTPDTRAPRVDDMAHTSNHAWPYPTYTTAATIAIHSASS